MSNKALVIFLAASIFSAFLFLMTQCNSPTVISSNFPDKIDFNRDVRPILSDKCYKCHGPDQKQIQAELRLDNPDDAFAALKSHPDQFAIVPGNLEKSIAYQRIISEDPLEQMPPPNSNLKLKEEEIKILKKWIAQGAEFKPHWAFIPPRAHQLPNVNQVNWPQNEIDYFILAKMEEQEFSPNEPAKKSNLLKRLAFDLTGLPPSIEVQNSFFADESKEAISNVIDQLMESPHYGEKMAIHWLDVARYADSHGYQDDGLRTMWPWRDWVIHAFNENYPYDKFLTYQLAGDLLPEKNKETLLATGFNRNHKITQEGGVIDEEYRIEYVTDRTNTFGKAFLAMTFECAKCHDHKYDPISQKDYFSAFAFFNHVPEKGIYGTIDASFADPPNMEITDEDVKGILSFVNKQEEEKLEVMIMKDSIGLRNTFLLDRGNYDAPAEQVDFGLPKAILPFDSTQYPKNRLGLSQWLVNKANPLTARVFVNRIWQEIFGKGIVKTSGDFGMQGNFPTHPELLDWLAQDFIKHDWDIKYLVKKIMTSATYQQSSVFDEDKRERDPENNYYARASRTRLSAELIRDHVLTSSGLLNPTIGGPSVKPYQPDGIWEAATSGRGVLKKYVQDTGEDLYRRGMYVFIKRTVPPPSMLVFDASNRDQCEVNRVRTNTPLQALVMLNDPHVLEASRVLAEQLMQKEHALEDKLTEAFQRIVCRVPKAEEQSLLLNYYNAEVERFQADALDPEDVLNIGEYPRAAIENKTELAALMQVIHTIYNLEESITKI